MLVDEEARQAAGEYEAVAGASVPDERYDGGAAALVALLQVRARDRTPPPGG